MNPLARDPAALAELHARIAAGDWDRARRLALVLGLHRMVEQHLMERDEHWLTRVARRFPQPPTAIELVGAA